MGPKEGTRRESGPGKISEFSAGLTPLLGGEGWDMSPEVKTRREFGPRIISEFYVVLTPLLGGEGELETWVQKR